MGNKAEFSISRSFNNTTIYFVTNVLQKAISFLLLPVYTIYLSTEDYGLVSLILSFLGVVSLLITLSLNGAVSRYFFIYKEDESIQKEFLGTIIFALVISSVLWLTTFLAFRNLITSYFLPGIDFFPFVFVGLLSTVTAPIYLVYQSVLQISQNAKIFAINSLAFFLIAVSLNLILVVDYNMGALGMLLATSIPNVLFSIYAVFSLISKGFIIFKFRFSFFKEAITYSIPLIPHNISGTIADYISRNLLYLKSNLSNVGLYNIAFQFGSILDLVVSSLYSALVPYYYNALDEGEEKEESLIRLITLIFRLISVVSLFVAFFSEELIYIMTAKPEYYDAWHAVPIIALSVVIGFLYSIYGTLLFYNINGTKYVWIASLSGNLFNILFTVKFTDYFSYVTPALALVIQKIVMFLLVYYLSRVIEPVRFELRKFFLILFSFMVFVVLGLMPGFLQISSLFEGMFNVFWKAFIWLVACSALLWRDKQIIYAFISSKIKVIKRK